jgi:hypothetical protein
MAKNITCDECGDPISRNDAIYVIDGEGSMDFPHGTMVFQMVTSIINSSGDIIEKDFCEKCIIKKLLEPRG